MGTPVFQSPVKEVWGETAAITTTASRKALVLGYQAVQFYCTSDVQYLLNPRITHFIFYDQTAVTYVDYASNVVDRVATTRAPADAMTSSDAIYVCCIDRITGFDADLGTKNANASVLTVSYWNGTAWASTSATDGTIAPAGTTLGVDGFITWVLPSAEAVVSGYTLGLTGFAEKTAMYWYKITVSATLSATVDILEVILINKGTAYGYLPKITQEVTPHTISLNVDKVGAIQLIAGGNVTGYLTWVKH